MQMKYGLLILSVLLTLLALVVLLRRAPPAVEGFESATNTIKKARKDTQNILLGVIAQAKRVSKYALDRSLWSESMENMTMSPMDLARRYIRQQNKKKTKKSKD